MFELFGYFLVVFKASTFAAENCALGNNQDGTRNVAKNLSIAGEL